jgi:hypothetical protein
MSDPNLARIPAVPAVPLPGTPTETDKMPDTPERPPSLVALESLWNNPGARTLVLLMAGALVIILAAALHYAGKSKATEKVQPATESTATATFGDFGGEETAAPGPGIEIRTPPEILGEADQKGSSEKAGPTDGSGLVDPGSIEITPLPSPPKYLTNPAVNFEFSWNHPDAITSDAEIVTGGFSNLPRGKKAWLVRRFTAEAKAYFNAVKVAWAKFEDLGYWGRPYILAKQQFDVAYNRLAAVQERLRGSELTDTECALILENLKNAVQFLHRINEQALRPTPVTVPDFTEPPNPAWAEWDRKRNSRKVH